MTGHLVVQQINGSFNAVSPDMRLNKAFKGFYKILRLQMMTAYLHVMNETRMKRMKEWMKERMKQHKFEKSWNSS